MPQFLRSLFLICNAKTLCVVTFVDLVLELEMDVLELCGCVLYIYMSLMVMAVSSELVHALFQLITTIFFKQTMHHCKEQRKSVHSDA